MAVNWPGPNSDGVDRSSRMVTGLTLKGVIEIQNMRYITSITENTDDDRVWVLGFTAPTFGDFDTFSDFDDIYTTPTLAIVSADAIVATATDVICHDLALPLSLASMTAGCQATADVEPDGDVDLADFAAFQNCYAGSGVPIPQHSCAPFDIDCDEDVDMADYRAIAPRLENR